MSCSAELLSVPQEGFSIEFESHESKHQHCLIDTEARTGVTWRRRGGAGREKEEGCSERHYVYYLG